jgi:hypothetical protein
MAISQRVREWFQDSNERRQYERMLIPVVALISNGGAPQTSAVTNVSPKGAYVRTGEQWYPGTIVSMVFRYDPFYLEVAEIAGDPEASMPMRARVRHSRKDGVGVEFVYLNQRERGRFEKFLAGAQVRGEK